MTPTARFFALSIAALGPLALPAAATSPLAFSPSEVWKRSSDGEVIYVAEHEDRLASLCIQIGQHSNWLPQALLGDIPLPKLDEVEIVHGMGFLHIEKHVPDWGTWGLSVSVPSMQDVQEDLVEGPTYFFVLNDGVPVFRVERHWRPSTPDTGVRTLEETWVPIGTTTLKSGACVPPSQ
ncbi:hypothetical protein [Pseudoxanthomonas sp. Root630]|uniref:hypothetical protein n=1 Tax=Pseudoxanthomonas sp. Root630 TaxID=1736574 RepID=UPI0007039198|nr:hypothetical protein [Pseudoxanthomonas sp. Root630]KRA41951.1 hypothetical protein ASD72_15345 [Pseudoxanthomonas sp. Root630]